MELRFLEEVRKLGGFAYAQAATLGAAGSLAAAEEGYDLSWEQLHSGSWESVSPIWRDAFALSCLQVASCLQGARLPEVMKYLDMGLIMGGSLFREQLTSAIPSLQAADQELQHHGGSEPCPHGFKKRKLMSDFSYEEDLQIHVQHGSGTSCPGEADFAGQVLPPLPQGSQQGQGIDEKRLPTLEEFLCSFFLPGKPVVIKDAISHWPAMKKWKDLDYIRKVAGSRTVPVEVGEHYLADGWKQQLMTISELIPRWKDVESSSTSRAYLAQHPLFEQIPELRQDIHIPDYCALGGGSMQSINAWFGPGGTVSPLHYDPVHNLFAQVVGRKYVRLYPAWVSGELYPHVGLMLKNSSQVDLDHPDHHTFPLAKDLPFVDCMLEPGDLLYIPPKWWHYVRSLSLSFSVSFWWALEDDTKTG